MHEKDNIEINLSLIPGYTQTGLAAATSEFIMEIIKDPENRNKLEKKKKDLDLCNFVDLKQYQYR